MLLSDDSDDDDDKISVIPIVGMGGIGKTTLAQLAYNNDQVKQKFNLRAWVCVSLKFDVFKITKNVLESVTSHVCDMKDLNSLQLHLKEKLTGKKFLIVLDDVWNENYVDWDLLLRPFQDGAKGSKILLTTRSEKVSSIVRTLPPYHVGQLSDKDCWLIFAKHACLYTDSTVDSNIEKIGRDIVKKCKGLPLVAKTLGGLLRLKHGVGEWSNILKSEMWDLSEEESGILPALRISYYYLSPELKRCFLYCSMFPQDYKFDKNKLILLWMAEGFLESSMRGKTLEEVGSEYFDDLHSRSFFQPYGMCFVMHDLIHDLAKFEARKFYSHNSSKDEITNMTRHIFRLDGGKEGFSGAVKKVKSLRTIVEIEDNYLEQFDLFLKLKRMRTLTFTHSSLCALPDSINKLIHLRYLNLSHSKFRKLPETLCNLYNLQTLILRDCYYLTMLPSNIQKLVNLRHLDVRICLLKEMPRGMGNLLNLQFLSDFVIGKDTGASIRELGALQNLHQYSLSIHNLQYVNNGVEALEARLVDKNIQRLSLYWNYVGDDIIKSCEVLDNLQPHQNLKYLYIYQYSGQKLSDWLGSRLYHNITDISLKYCNKCRILPPLGQLPSLKRLEMEEFEVLEKIGCEFYKNDADGLSLTPSFPSLEDLRLRRMPKWQEWWYPDEANVFPQLRYLTLEVCPSLSGHVPPHLPTLKKLHIHDCQQLASPVLGAQEIDVTNCSNMEFPEQLHFEHAVSLKMINSCDSLTCLQLDNFSNLREVEIKNCKDLKLVLNSRMSLQHLKHIFLYNCPTLASFAMEGLFAPNITELSIVKCPNLKSLPHNMISLPKLKYIWLSECPSIEWFPEESFLPNLKELATDHFVFSRMLRCTDSQFLCSLYSLKLCGNYDESVQLFPEEGFLPPSLTHLTVQNYSSLEMLDCKGFLHLTFLKSLFIKDCPKLERIEGDLPASLQLLFINGCCLFEEQWRMNKGMIWPKISHISKFSIGSDSNL